MLQGNSYVEKPTNLDFPKSNGLVRYESAVYQHRDALSGDRGRARGEGIQSLSAKFPVGR